MDLPTTTRQQRVSAAQRSSEATVAAANKANNAALAAQRNSEATVAAAERQARIGYSRPKRHSVPAASAVPQPPPPYPPQPYYGFPTRLPLPQDTKMEQARLLTLLRAVHPSSIIDQLCKGLAYFGGIPGAPPPPNGVFPVSENHNGSGALFVNWLSEIFPPIHSPPSGVAPGHPTPGVRAPSNLTRLGASQPQGLERDSSEAMSRLVGPERPDAGPQIDPVVLPKRKRGRPKGSKASKPRKDKGIKKGPNPNRILANNTKDGSTATGAPNTNAPVAGTSVLPGPQSTNPDRRENTASNLTPSGKRRGRPPGSKNKPKPLPLRDSNTPIAQAAPVVHDEDMMNQRHTLPDESSPTTSRSGAQSLPQVHLQVQPGPESQRMPQSQQFLGTLPAPALTPHPAVGADSGATPQALASRKRKQPNNTEDPGSHSNGSLHAPQQASMSGADSQGHADPAQPSKRRRASNGVGGPDLPVESSEIQSPGTSAPGVAVTVNPGDIMGSSGSVTPGSNFESSVQASQAKQSGSGQQRMQQTSAQIQKPQFQIRQAQNRSPAASHSIPRPAQTSLASSQQSTRQPSGYGNPSQQRPAQVPQSWQRAMVGPQQAANPDAQPVAQHPRYNVQSKDTQRR
ncbi:hypothetical protein NLU13_9220 [Sarocladium strictum]|uniref:Uncharacterized protein n=1 Tax=Sarocladium strictum TaxID=5046 RepID=A0AA39GBX6_SARSR|nr:hypothetical protein NLU13_9220 [Sarocladium strictum]